MVKVAVLVSGGGTNLQALIDSSSRNEMPSCELSLVISSKSSAYAIERAKQNNIPVEIVEKTKEQSSQEYGLELIKTLKAHEIELVVLAGFLHILHENVIKAFPERIINIHPSLIPAFSGDGYYGLKVHEAALQKGVKITGATVHLVNEITDGGKILAQKAVKVEDDDTAKTLQQRVMMEAEWILLPQVVESQAKQMRCK